MYCQPSVVTMVIVWRPSIVRVIRLPLWNLIVLVCLVCYASAVHINSRLVHVPFYCNNRFIKTDWCIIYTYVIHTVLPLASYHINVSLQSYGTLINWNAGSCCLDMLAGLLLKWVLGISIGNLCISLECMVVVFSGST